MRKTRQYLVDTQTYFATPYTGGPKPKTWGLWSAKRSRQLTGPCVTTWKRG
jgi:hypothetical protein